MTSDDLIFRSSVVSVPSEASRFTSSNHGLSSASNMTSKPNIWKHCVFGSPRAAAGSSACNAAHTGSSTAIKLLRMRSSTSAQRRSALSVPSCSASRRRYAESVHFEPMQSSATERRTNQDDALAHHKQARQG